MTITSKVSLRPSFNYNLNLNLTKILIIFLLSTENVEIKHGGGYSHTATENKVKDCTFFDYISADADKMKGTGRELCRLNWDKN